MDFKDILKGIAPTIASALETHRLFRANPSVESSADCFVVDAYLPTPLSESFGFAIASYKSIVASVISLFFVSSPSAVFGGVASINVYSVESHVVRLNSHVSKEVIELKPSFADSNTPPSVTRVFNLLWVGTSLDHRSPSKVGWSVSHTVSNAGRSPRFSLKASAGFCMPDSEEGCCSRVGIATIASATPSEFSTNSSFLYRYKPPKPLPGDINRAVIQLSVTPARGTPAGVQVRSAGFGSATTITYTGPPNAPIATPGGFAGNSKFPKTVVRKVVESWHDAAPISEIRHYTTNTEVTKV